eukprot:CAMPEP_0174835574 /NCGR_PEP_ID=MMETSP1114-20130205/5478_1 /TAXON_ID=312471 /ORGANISM="Neobodo designis, Strain CCAP 1951/1" /LENGTH=169 /DNA_ID=CAMNT_0016069525 /DNA_START=134 /DNA_END=639 /DNA_ORIENTATION=+
MGARKACASAGCREHHPFCSPVGLNIASTVRGQREGGSGVHPQWQTAHRAALLRDAHPWLANARSISASASASTSHVGDPNGAVGGGSAPGRDGAMVLTPSRLGATEGSNAGIGWCTSVAGPATGERSTVAVGGVGADAALAGRAEFFDDRLCGGIGARWYLRAAGSMN